MWNNILYGLLYGWIKLHALLPFPVLYFLSDILYVLVYKMIGYRKRVVRRNMKAAFPDKSDKDLRLLEREFYHHFTDYIVETIKMAHLSPEQIKKHANVTNPELIDELSGGKHSCVVMYMGHYGNWEWFTCADLSFKYTQLYQLYRPLKNKLVDRLFISLRTRYGSLGIKKNDTIREVINLEKNHERSAVAFISDQTPSKANIHYWTSFLNQETPFYTGAERIARKMDLPVAFLDVQKIKRGYYKLDIRTITTSAKETPEFWLTEQYARLMEHTIMRNPAYWLWTHKRWKHKREESV